MRKAFMLYTSDMKLLDKLTIEQRGILLTAIAAYVADEELPEMDQATDIFFSTIAAQIDRDGEKYERKVERLRDNASKSNRNRNDIESKSVRNRNDISGVAVADAVADAVAVADKDKRAKRGRNKRPAEQHDYDWKQIDVDLLRRQREGLTT